MDDLIARLEQATEGSHELNAAIGALLGWQPPKRDDGVRPRWALWLAPDGNAKQLPWFSESLDAKLPGENIVVVYAPKYGPPERAHFLSWAATHRNDKHPTFVEGYGRTEALARRVAALKARE